MASSWSGYGPSAPHPSQLQPPQQNTESSSSKKPQPRQLLSCTKCRERKVKCDRTKPCSACCARGHPKECQFIVGEGNDYSPIQQSYEIKELRRENLKLKEQLRDARAKYSAEDDDDVESPDRSNTKATSRATAARQRRFRTTERIDNIYFGTPGLANIVSDFANLQVGSHSLTHTVPRGQDMYPAEGSYPFKMVPVGDNTAAALTALLPPDEVIFQQLDLFERRAHDNSFPHVPDDLTKKEVERFLQDKETNASKAPDMLGLIFATLAVGMQIGVFDVNGGRRLEASVANAQSKGEVYLGASMQALRYASFMNTPTLLGIQTLVMMGPYLTNSGRFLDAWTLFGLTIRLAHSMGLHRNPKFIDPVPPLRECMIRRTLWWWMLHMDQQYSVTLGRPLGISGIGDCPPPEPLTTNTTVLRLGEFVNHFTIVARQILGSDGLMSIGRIDEFTDKLLGLWDTMPETLQFNESWTRPETVLPDWPLDVMSATLFAKVQSFLILLNRQRDERTTRSASSNSPPTFPNTLAGINSTTYTSSNGGMDGVHHQAPIRGRPLVINSSVQLLQTFLFFSHRHPAVLICWTIGQQAFNAAMIIMLDAWEMDHEQNMWLVDEALLVFTELQRNGIHKLAELAVVRITKGIVLFKTRQRERQDATNAAAAAAAASRRSSQHHYQQQPGHPNQQPYQYSPPDDVYHLYQPILSLNTDDTSSYDMAGDTIMGNTVMGQTGMFLLEDPGLQSHNPAAQHFAPWSLSLPASTTAASPGSSETSPTTTTMTGRYSPSAPSMVPASNVPIAPFPVMSPPFQPTMVPMLASPFSVGLQPRMPMNSGRGQQGSGPNLQGQQPQMGSSPPSGVAAAGIPQQQQQQQFRPQAMQGQQLQHQQQQHSHPPHHHHHQSSRHGYSPYQSQSSSSSRRTTAAAAAAAHQGHGHGHSHSQTHRLERPPSSRSRSGRTAR